MTTKQYPNNLREFRVRAGLRQIDVAKRLGLDCADRLSRWENGLAVPNVVNLLKLAVIYDATPQQIFSQLYNSIQEGLNQQPSHPL